MSNMNKVYIVKGSKGTRNYKLYTELTELIGDLGINSTKTILTYELTNSVVAKDLFKTLQRDNSIRNLEGELSEYEQNINDFISYIKDKGSETFRYRENKYDIRYLNKQMLLTELIDYKLDNKYITKFIKKYKFIFIVNVSTEVEYYEKLLKVVKFNNCELPMNWGFFGQYGSIEACYNYIDIIRCINIKQDIVTNIIRENFAIAKKNIKKK